MAQVLVLATLATKAEEAGFLTDRLAESGVSSEVVDTSLDNGGAVLGGDEKREAMEAAATKAAARIAGAIRQGTEVVVGIGGGTGGEIILRVMRDMPITFPKILVTTMPFDPRAAVADNSIILVPTLADISGLNDMLREALENAALMTAGLCRKSRKGELTSVRKSVGITALGATDAAVRSLVTAFSDRGRETTVFHSNGYGGAAFVRFAKGGAFDAIVDLTPHELTRLHVAGAHVDMPERFSAGGDLPRVVLPGALNFMGLGAKATVPGDLLARPHYAHSGFFTHVRLSEDEMRNVSSRMAQALNALSGPVAVIVPMGGFSNHDCPGGLIEDPGLRGIFLETMRAELSPGIAVTVEDAHISDPLVTGAILKALDEITS